MALIEVGYQKKLTKKAKKKGNEPLFKWIKCVSNHLWWCSQTCGGNAEALRERWVSILNHVVNKHKWKNSKHFRRCEHGRLSIRKERKTKWLEDGTSAYVALEEVVLNKKFLKDIEKLTEFHHTGELEVYHSLLLKYVPSVCIILTKAWSPELSWQLLTTTPTLEESRQQ